MTKARQYRTTPDGCRAFRVESATDLIHFLDHGAATFVFRGQTAALEQFVPRGKPETS